MTTPSPVTLPDVIHQVSRFLICKDLASLIQVSSNLRWNDSLCDAVAVSRSLHTHGHTRIGTFEMTARCPSCPSPPGIAMVRVWCCNYNILRLVGSGGDDS